MASSSKEINLVLAGGVNRGISLQGAVQALEDAGVTFKGIAGTSAGAVLGTAIAAGISSSDLKDELYKADFSSFVDGQPSENIWNFGNVLAMNEGTKIQEWLTGILQKHLGATANLTFGNPAFQRFSCFACDISRSELVRFPDDLKKLYSLDSENFSVVKAARASMAVPFFFDPVKIEKNAGTGSAETSVLVDGGLVSGFPIGAFESQTIPTIGILIYDKPGFNAKIETPVDVGVAMATFLVNFYDDLASRSSTQKDIIFIPPVDGIDPFDFNLTPDDKKKLYDKGYNIARDFITNHKWLSQ